MIKDDPITMKRLGEQSASENNMGLSDEELALTVAALRNVVNFLSARGDCDLVCYGLRSDLSILEGYQRIRKSEEKWKGK